VGYVIRSFQQQGVSRAQMNEIIAMAFVHAGPRGMQTLYQAIEGVDFEDAPDPPAKFPEGWTPDPAAFHSGIDHATPFLLEGERDKIEAWYLKAIGEIPPHVTFLANHRPLLLKTHRSRMETMLKTLPKQMWPTYMLYYHVMTRCAEGIRENVLLCKAWGVSKSDTLDVIGNALVYGQMEAASMVQTTAGEIFDAWAD
jgi:alkylhydroperoxidase/carboxymuconolactone decarboxylase family protein YurZ